MFAGLRNWIFTPTQIKEAKIEPQRLTKPDGYKSSQSSSAIILDPSGNLMVKPEKSNSEEEKSND